MHGILNNQDCRQHFLMHENLYTVRTGMKILTFPKSRHHLCAQRWGSMVATVYDSNRGSLKISIRPVLVIGLDRSSLHIFALQTKKHMLFNWGEVKSNF